MYMYNPYAGEGNGTPLQYSCLEKSHGRRSLVGCSPWGRKELDTTERLHFHFSLSCIGEGNGNPLQCSCLKNPRDGGAWWAAIYGVAQSRTRLNRLSSSSSSIIPIQSVESGALESEEPRFESYFCLFWKCDLGKVVHFSESQFPHLENGNLFHKS